MVRGLKLVNIYVVIFSKTAEINTRLTRGSPLKKRYYLFMLHLLYLEMLDLDNGVRIRVR